MKKLLISIVLILNITSGQSQTCSGWLFTGNAGQNVTIGDLDVTGNKITVEATFVRTQPWSGNYLFAGDLVSKHDLPNNVNYLLRPNSAEITTTTGYHVTPPICEIEINKTYHVALVYDGNSLKFYRNGYLMSQAAATGNLVNNNLITTIGDYAYNNPVGTNFVGHINEVRIWNIARTQSQIQFYINAQIPTPAMQPGLLAYYTFNNLLNRQGTALWNGTLNGGALLNTNNPNCPMVVDSCGILPGIGGVINSYTPVLGLSPCDNSIIVSSTAEFSVGDTVVLMQMKGATVNTTNTNNFGNVENINSCGNYEFNYIKSITGNSIELLNELESTYEIPTGRVQLIRVPYYPSVTISSTLTCPPWDGFVGGVLILNVQDTIHLNANIDVSGKGFRGGAGQNTNTSILYCSYNAYFYPNTEAGSAFKGESIFDLNNTMGKGKGKAATGGGGGSGHNSGGGGGGNGGGGGFGGFQLNNCNNPIDNRGIGGRSLSIYSTTLNKIFLGGGGGAGHADSYGNFFPSGGKGGGIAIIKGQALVGNGFNISADGGNPQACNYSGTNSCHDAMGGGGAGGSVFMNIGYYNSNVHISAVGADGGDMVGSVSLGGRIGGGGGGGGGAIHTNLPSFPPLVTTNTSGGENGVLTQDGDNSFGATSGQLGIIPFNANLVISNTQFQPNIDTIFINTAKLTCTSVQFGALPVTHTSPVTDWEWDFGDGNTSIEQNPIHNFSSSGAYNIRLIGTDANGCKDTSDLSLNIQLPTLSVSSDQQFCSSSPVNVTVTASGNGTLNWTPSILFPNPTLSTQTITLTTSTTLSVTNSLGDGCEIADSIHITINPGYNISESLEICTGQLPYLWNSQSLSAPGNYIANLVSADGCDSTINLTLSILDTLRSNEALSVCNDLLPYIWNSQSLNSSGTYTAFLTSADGCDSMVVMNFQVKNATTSLNTQTICSSQTPLIWNGQSLNTSGTFTANLINAAGCDSTATLQLTVNPVANSTTTLAICSNQTPFAWNGQNYTSGGTYTVNLTASNGCDSLAQLNLTVNPIRNSNTNVAICDDLLPYSWNGQSYSAAGAYSVNLTSSLGCDSIANLNLEVHHPQTSNTTLTICSAQVPYTWNGININAAGNYIANLQSAAGCDSTANLTLSVLDTLFENRSQVICADAFPLMWNGQQINAPGNYAHNLMAVSGCDSVITLQLSTHNYQPLNAIPDTAVCRGASVQLFVTGAGFNNFQWSPGTQLTGANSSTPTFTGNLNTQMIRVIATDNNGCLSADSVLITLREPPLVLAGNDTVACNMQPVQLNAQGASTYVWSPAANFNNYQIANPAFTGTVSSALTVTGTDIYGCSSIDSLWMEVRSAAALLAPPGTGMCPGGQVQLDGANGNAYTYLWSPAATIQNPNIINPIATPTSTTTYTVSITDPVCLFTRDFPVLVEVFPLPDIRLTKPSDITCTQREVVLTASGGQSYVWLPAHGLIQSSGANATVSPTRDTRYTVRGTDSRGCSDSASVDVKMLALDGLFYLPNAFTPNGDGLNECFGALHWGAVTNFKLMIFNRWGEKVFETTNPGICWDGIYKGKPSQVGNYVYHVIGQTGCGKMERKGNVLLLR